MSPYSKSGYFLWLTVLFIVSMLLVVTMSNFFFLMLGWDGLGLVSFFLIVYYQNQSSITSGLFTLLINRIGDCFFLVSIVLLFYNYTNMFVNSSYVVDCFVVLIIVITFITKSAIYPFTVTFGIMNIQEITSKPIFPKLKELPLKISYCSIINLNKR